MTFEESLTPQQRKNRNDYESYLVHVVCMDKPEGYLETISGTSGKLKKLDDSFTGNLYDYSFSKDLKPFYDVIFASRDSRKILDGKGNNTNSTPFKKYMEMLWAREIFANSVICEAMSEEHPDYPEAKPTDAIKEYLKAIKAKPFLILGGFSGTGKSQSVKELAYMTCADVNGLQQDKMMPGNYCLVSVKPNWHDSTDLLGYYSSINDKYFLTDFVRFLVKAMQSPNVPFFACIDEMNLAPVEEYFAEYLSVLESREYNPTTKRIESAALLSKDVFTKSYGQFNIFNELGVAEDSKIAESLKKHGLRLPENVVVIGTVNMDDTTHSFSRKVIDRAMTFETQIKVFTADVFDNEGNLHYVSNPMNASEIMPEFASAKDAIAKLKADGVETEALMKEVSEFINEVNTALKGSPFQISYRVLNETLLYYYANRTDNINEVFNAMLMRKVLPRIEGDQEKAQRPLNALLKWITDDKHDDEAFHNSKAKIMEMRKPFEDGGSGFTTFWN